MHAEDHTIGDDLKVRIYKPEAPGQDGTELPLLLFAHGGGWFAGNLDTEDRTCRIVASMVPAIVVSVDYRCNYDVPLSDMVDDMYTVFNWSQQNPSVHGADLKSVLLWGGSAGGSLVVALAHRLIQENRASEIAGLIHMNGLALHPDAAPKEYKHLMRSYGENDGQLPFVSGQNTLDLYEYRNIVPSPDRQPDIRLFPAAGGADAVKGFPPTYIVTSGSDASRDDGTVLEACLKDAGVRVKRENIDGLAHYFWVFNLQKANERFWTGLTQGVRWTLDG